MLSRMIQQRSPKTWLRYGLLISLLIGSIIVIKRLPPWPIHHVAISKPIHHIDPHQLHDVITPYLPAGFFHLDLNMLQATLEQQPWIANVSLRRAWPDTLVVTIDEHTPVAQWQDNGLFTQQGHLFHPTPHSIPTDLPKLSGPSTDTAKIFNFWQQAQQQLNQQWQPIFKQATPTIIAVDCSQRHDWRILLSDQSTIILGRDSTLIQQRLNQLAQAYPQLPHINKRLHQRQPTPRYLDFRYPHGFAIKNISHNNLH